MEFKNVVLFLVLSLFLIMVFSIIRASFFGSVQPSTHIYFEIVLLLLLAIIGELAVSYLKIPSVMILLILGILISPSFISVIWSWLHALGIPIPTQPPGIFLNQGIIQVFAQLGAVILLFKVGLHNKIEGIFSFDNLLVATAGVIFPFFVGYLYASFSGGSLVYSMFLGAALTATSTGVTVALLKEYGVLSERFAQIIIGASIIDDVLGLLVLSFVINLSQGNGSLTPIILTGLSSIIFLLGSVLAGEYFIRYLDQNKLNQRHLVMVLIFMFLYAYVAEYIGLSAIVGAFMAGVVLNRSHHLNEIEEKTYALEVVFMPIFFISLGLLVDVNAIILLAIPIIILTLLAVISKFVACFGASLAAKLTFKDSLAVGIGMVPRGEVALIVASFGLSASVLTSAEYSSISVMALLTTLIMPPLLSWSIKKE